MERYFRAGASWVVRSHFELVPSDAEALDLLNAGIAQPDRPPGADVP